MIEIVQGDVLAAQADAVILTVDGAKRGMEGNIARAYARRWPDAWMEIEDEIRYPIPLGRSIAIRPESESGFPGVLIASTLHHLDALAEQQKAAIVLSALAGALQLAIRHRVRRLATAPMTGGWRLALKSALSAMMGILKPFDVPDHALTIALHLLSKEHVQLAVEIAMAYRVDARTGEGSGQ